jgi:hypothetical protein
VLVTDAGIARALASTRVKGEQVIARSTLVTIRASADAAPSTCCPRQEGASADSSVGLASAVNTPKRTLLLGLLSALPTLSLPQALFAQVRPALPRVVYVFTFKTGPSAPFVEAFLERFAELGWVPGKNVQFEVRDAQGSP